ncbi:MAG: thioredoxin domain-containing protein [Bdellovibrionaceae bacterium]|nr:thioredoxin domain-containing protein [Pseudobdellovibrionaceae bacterium]
MKKIFALIVLIVVLAFSIIAYRRSLITPLVDIDENYRLGAISFQSKALERTDIATRFLNISYSHVELIEKSPILHELALQELNMLIEASSKIIKSLPPTQKKPLVIIMAAKPSKKYFFDAVKYAFDLNFSVERPFGHIVIINEKKYLRQNLPMNQMKYSEIKTQQFNQRLKVIKGLYTRQLLLKLAKEKNISIGELVKNTVSQSNLNTSNSVDTIIASSFPNAVADIFFYPPNYIFPMNRNKIITNYPSDIKEVRPTLIIIGSLSCNGCQKLLLTLKNLQNNYNEEISFGFIQFFQNADWRQQMVAEASMCLNQQSYESFWMFSKKLSSNMEPISEDFIMNTAKETGVKFDNFKNCMLSHSFKVDVEKQLKYSHKIGTTKSPTVIVGGSVLTGIISEEQLINAIKGDI